VAARARGMVDLPMPFMPLEKKKIVVLVFNQTIISYMFLVEV
jgi:hypothetical protein